MNIQAEANRLFYLRMAMQPEAFRKELLSSLEDIYKKGLQDGRTKNN